MCEIKSHVIPCRNREDAEAALKKIFDEIDSHARQRKSESECAEPEKTHAQHAAKAARELYDALQAEGFTAEDAMKLTCAILS